MDFTCNGIWWLPGGEKIAGTLTFSDKNGAELSLAGILGAAKGSFEEKTIPLIHGLVYDCPFGNVITLRGSFLRSFSMGMPGFGRETYHVAKVFTGEHLSSDEFNFSHARLRYSGLSGWAHGLTGLTYDRSRKRGRNAVWEVRWSWAEPITGRIPGGSLTLGVGANFSSGIRRASINEHVAISLTFDEPRSEESIQSDYAYPLQNFFSLATDQPNTLEEIVVQHRPASQDIRVLAARVFYEPKDTEYLLPHKMIFSLEDVADSPVALLSRWIEAYPRLKHVCGPFFAMQYRPSYTDIAFLTTFQSLQIYQGQRASMADEGERLRQLLQQYWGLIGSLFADDVNAVTTRFLQLRDFIVHRNSNLGDEPDYAVQLYWSGQRLAFLLKACLLTELAFSQEELKKFFSRNQSFLHLQGLTEPKG